ncbi:hypothetical protein Plhal710r2_c012g0055391 [Plasmopara halstedii]
MMNNILLSQLFRTELNGQALVISEVDELDILEFRRKTPVQHFDLTRRRARLRLTTRPNRLRLLVAYTKRPHHNATDRTNTLNIFLRAGIQSIECIHLVQLDVRRLLFFLRDAVLGNHSVSICDLLSIAKDMVVSMTHTKADTSAVLSSWSQAENENLIRKF